MPDSVHPDERERIAAEAVADMIAGSSIDDDALTVADQKYYRIVSSSTESEASDER